MEGLDEYINYKNKNSTGALWFCNSVTLPRSFFSFGDGQGSYAYNGFLYLLPALYVKFNDLNSLWIVTLCSDAKVVFYHASWTFTVYLHHT